MLIMHPSCNTTFCTSSTNKIKEYIRFLGHILPQGQQQHTSAENVERAEDGKGENNVHPIESHGQTILSPAKSCPERCTNAYGHVKTSRNQKRTKTPLPPRTERKKGKKLTCSSGRLAKKRKACEVIY